MTNYKTITWPSLLKRLGELLGVEIDRIFDVQKLLEEPFVYGDLTACPEWDSYEDGELFKRYVDTELFCSGTNLIIVHDSYLQDDRKGPYEVNGSDLADFVEHYWTRKIGRGCFFDGCDIFFINLEKRAIFFFHHSYYYANKKLSSLEEGANI